MSIPYYVQRTLGGKDEKERLRNIRRWHRHLVRAAKAWNPEFDVDDALNPDDALNGCLNLQKACVEAQELYIEKKRENWFRAFGLDNFGIPDLRDLDEVMSCGVSNGKFQVVTRYPSDDPRVVELQRSLRERYPLSDELLNIEYQPWRLKMKRR